MIEVIKEMVHSDCIFAEAYDDNEYFKGRPLHKLVYIIVTDINAIERSGIIYATISMADIVSISEVTEEKVSRVLDELLEKGFLGRKIFKEIE